MASVGIVGAGVFGRVLALTLLHKFPQHTITLFEKGSLQAQDAALWTAAGMLAPWSESPESSDKVFQWGVRSLALWPCLLARLGCMAHYQAHGTVHVATIADKARLAFALQAVRKRDPQGPHAEYEGAAFRDWSAGWCEGLGSTYRYGVYFPAEASVDPRQFIDSSTAYLCASGVSFLPYQQVLGIEARTIHTQDRSYPFDVVVDTRGMGAQSELPLRGIRGELVRVRAPLVPLSCVVRVNHMRYPVYIVPRKGPNNMGAEFIIGATSTECESRHGIEVQSLLELLSAASLVHDGFLRAEVLETAVNIRPALPSQDPEWCEKKGVFFVNGGYRSGITVAPAFIEDFCHASF